MIMGEVYHIMSFKLKSDEVREKKEKRGLVTFSAVIAVLVISVFSVYKFVTSNMKMNELNQQYNELLSQTQQVEESNAEISRYLEDDADLDGYIENMARDKLDYAMPDEKIYYIVPYAGE